MSNFDLQAIADFFNNQSVRAFFGAFAAYMLVSANDSRREGRKVKTLRAEIEVSRSDARAKLETARRMRTLLLEHNQINPAPLLKFNTTFTRQITSDVLHRLTLHERRAVEALCYTMEAIDEIVEESVALAKSLIDYQDPAKRQKIAKHLLLNWGNTISNINRLIEMCDLYLAGKSSQLVEKQYDAAQYEER